MGDKRINKRTGHDIASEHIVRGVKVPGGDYVVLGDDEIKAAYPKMTQTIEIESFVPPTQIACTLLEKPYYLEPIGKGDKVYALLCEALIAAGVVGIARVVMHTKEHLAVLVPVGAALMLDTLRWAAEVRPWNDLKLPPEGVKAADLKDSGLKMAGQLMADMTEDWQPDRYEDRFTQAVQAPVDQRAAAGRTESVQPLEAAASPDASNVVDLTELLKRSLGQKRGAPGPAPAPGPRPLAPQDSRRREGQRPASELEARWRAMAQTGAPPAKSRRNCPRWGVTATGATSARHLNLRVPPPRCPEQACPSSFRNMTQPGCLMASGWNWTPCCCSGPCPRDPA